MEIVIGLIALAAILAVWTVAERVLERGVDQVFDAAEAVLTPKDDPSKLDVSKYLPGSQGSEES